MINWFPIRLSFVVATAATLIALIAGSALAWLLARKRFPGRNLVDALVTLPLVLPPTVLGYYLLVLLGTRSPLGSFLYRTLGIRLTFTVTAAIIAASIHALPLVTKSLRAAFEGVNTELEAAARTLGLNNRLIFFRVTLPLAGPALGAGAVLCWARALGEFGATITFAGNFPGTTQTMPLAVYLSLESSRPETAIVLSLVLLLVSLAVLVGLRDRWLGVS